MPKIKYAVFDVGQTIYPFSLDPLVELMQNRTVDSETFKTHTPKHYDYNPYMKGLITDKEFADELCVFCRVPQTPEMSDKIAEALHKGVLPRYPETLQGIKLLKTQKTEICILSNALPLLADTATDIAEPKHSFTSFELGLLKPDTAIYEAVRQRLNVPFNQILFIDDKEKNVAAAQSLGINGIVYRQQHFLDDLKTYLTAPVLTRPTLHR